MSYSEKIIAELEKRYADQPEFIQAAREVLTTIQPALDAHPEYERVSLLERLVEPERIIMFRVPWVDDAGKVQVNRGIVLSSIQQLDRIRAGCACTPPSTFQS